MKAYYYNIFKSSGELLQIDKNKEVFVKTNINVGFDFTLDESGMELFLKFKSPKIKLNGNVLELKEGKTKVNIKTLDFTAKIDIPSEENKIVVNLNDLKTACKFVATSGARPVLLGVNINDKYIVSTDSFHLFRKEIENASGNSIIVPTNFIKELKSDSDTIELNYNGNAIWFTDNDTTYYSKLYNGTYPNVDKLFPQVSEHTITVDKEDFKNFLTLISDKNQRVRMGNGIVTILDEVGFELCSQEFEEFTNDNICVSYDMLLKIVNCIDSDLIYFEFTGEIKPIIINSNFLLLPVKVV